MSTRQPRWEIVQTRFGFHARFKASNGAIIVSSEVYERRRSAVRAVEIVEDARVYLSSFQDHPEIAHGDGMVEIRDIDERSAQ